MAEAILGAFVKVAVEKLLTLAKAEFGSMLGFHEDIRQLRNKLLLIQGLLRDAEKNEQSSHLVKEWLQRLNDVAFDADDVLDEFATVSLNRRIQASERKQVCNLLSCATPPNILFQYNMSRKIKEIRVKLDAIEKDRPDLQLIIGESGQEMQLQTNRQRETSSLVDQSRIFGRQEERKRLRELLVCDEVREKNFSVIPIVGIGGMGKTTLAQLVYNDEIINKEFERKFWVCVSEDFDVKRLTREIIYSATKQRCDSEQLDVLQCELKEILSSEKRFLLVLDDVWNEKSDEWEKLRVSLINGKKGSAVVVTTRNESVSRLMGTVPFIKLEGLSEEDCLSLFNQRAFGEEGPNRYPELEDIGKEIVRKCKGLTLAVKTLGGILATKRDAREWRNILDSEVWDSKGSDEIIPILKLSYNHLSSSHLKQCFAYCSLFPKDHQFDKWRMIRLWMGEGLIQAKDSEQLEDIGLEYFNELVSIGFLEFSESDETIDYFQMYIMHDLVHDLAQFVAKGVYVTEKFDKSRVTFENARHLSVALNSSEEPLDFGSLFNCKSLRTILLTYYTRTTQPIPHDVFLKLRCLRVLDLSGANIEKLPNSMGKLKHLRYLNLSKTKIRQLPESVTTLFNLQTLLLDSCEYLFYLPKDTKILINLRHLSLCCVELSNFPPEIGKLTSLQTLTPFVVGKTSGNGIEELKNLVNLRLLKIARLENVVNGEMAKEADMKKKQHLHRLVLIWSEEDRDMKNNGQRNDDEGILEALQPHSNLKILGIKGYRGSSFPDWIDNSSLLSNLVFLILWNCDNCRRLPSLGQLPSLKELWIIGLNGVEHVGREFVGKMTGFLSLETLYFNIMENLKEWSDVEEGDFPKLRELLVFCCPKLSTVPKRFESIINAESCPLLTTSETTDNET